MANTHLTTGKLNSRGARVLLAAGAIAAAAIAATPAANASDFRTVTPTGNPSYIQVHTGYQATMLSEYEIRYFLRSCDYNRIESISYVPGAYIVQAWRFGRLENLRVDPYQPRILSRSVVQVRGYHQPHRNSNPYRNRGSGIYFRF